MNICLVSADFYPNIGGVAAHVIELGKSFVKAGHKVFVVTLPLGSSTEAFETWQGMEVFRTSIPKQRPFYTLLLRPWLKKFVKRHHIDVVHVHGMRPLEASKGLSCPVIFTNHTSGFLKRLEAPAAKYQKIGKRLRHLDHILAPSEQLCEASRQVGYTGPVSFIPNAVDIERFCPQVHDKTLPNDADSPIALLMARRLVAKNGVIIFAQAMAFLSDLNIKIIIAGDGEEREKVLDTLYNAGLEEKTEFLGAIDNADMPDIYRSADISVLPSFMEATSITGLESMACGLPLVGTNVGGIPAIIDEHKTGLLVPPGDPEALATALRSLVIDASRRKQMGQAARLKAEQEFSWPVIARRTLNVFAGILTNREKH